MEEKKSTGVVAKIAGGFLAAVSCFGVIIPVIGFSYFLGYLDAFGLDNNAFPISLWDLWKYCFYAAFELALGSFKYLFIVGWIAFSFIYFLIALLLLKPLTISLDKSGLFPKFLKMEIKFPLIPESGLFRWLFISSKFFMAILAALVLLVGAFYGLYKFGALGHAKGKQVLVIYRLASCNRTTRIGWGYCVDYSNPNKPKAKAYNGLLVAASSTHIAIFDKSVVSVIPRSPEYVLTRTYKPKK